MTNPSEAIRLSSDPEFREGDSASAANGQCPDVFFIENPGDIRFPAPESLRNGKPICVVIGALATPEQVKRMSLPGAEIAPHEAVVVVPLTVFESAMETYAQSPMASAPAV